MCDSGVSLHLAYVDVIASLGSSSQTQVNPRPGEMVAAAVSEDLRSNAAHDAVDTMQP